MSETISSVPRYLTCPACFAKDIDPVILHFDEHHREYYCMKCTYTGTKAEVFEFYHQLQAKRYRVCYRPRT